MEPRKLQKVGVEREVVCITIVIDCNLLVLLFHEILEKYPYELIPP